ncbi:hypothetical protein M409DRAFT_27259 [Zasmidium cellare ATCC 36951]|uniref:Nucleolar protein 16 n=1 Tax=Zasmidium cellare ATCC 36951 TaxID=1080233 RepID=A0A6A6C5G8_ZASCE|nr:uncharacterized protein M409DRAFT_27259 [Zasmidium cellare ATCC 36951]KAF2162255.1 hypothetical protein M409DRAFT_27259 [Zasmidium cellare ATCC 36951]
MGRELQKRKNRSSISKTRQKPKSKKKILTNPIIATAWDKSQSLAQNYKRLGLTAKLNKNTGGVERNVSDVLREAKEGGERKVDTLNIASSSRRRETLEVGEARIERDPVSGAILRVVEQEGGRANPLGDPLNELDSSSDDEEDEDETDLLNPKKQHGNTNPSASIDSEGKKTETVRRLEEEARKPAAKYKRKQPEGEVAFVEELVRKYGDDYGKMARDMKINYMQRSAGDLKRRVKKWRENGGRIE